MTDEFWKRIPNWLFAGAFLLIAIVLAIQLLRGRPVVCDGTWLPSKDAQCEIRGANLSDAEIGEIAQRLVDNHSEKLRATNAKLSDLTPAIIAQISTALANDHAEELVGEPLVAAISSELALKHGDEMFRHEGLPDSAIVAFDSQCPQGWRRFESAASRMIVGASTKQQLDDGPSRFRRGSNLENLSPRPLGEPGGTEQVRLSPQEMPTHRHGLARLSLGEELEWKDGGTDTNIVYFDLPNPATTAGRKQVDYISAENGTRKSGGDQPHYNMPPYIALYFCQKG